MKKLCYFNGEIMALEDAKISPNDLGILTGYGIFDYLRTYNAKPFLLPQHLDRLFNSLKLMGLDIKESRGDIAIAINRLMEKSSLSDAGFRLVVTGGDSNDGFQFTAPHLFILIDELPQYDERVWSDGVKLMMHEYLRDLPEVKSINYIEAIRMQPERIRRKAFDILYIHKNNVLECTRSNFFIFQGNVLVTPKENVLIGRTRNLVIELAKSHFIVEERNISIDEITSADEAFLTGTTKKVMPVNMLDDIKVGNAKAGKNTLKLMNRFDEYVKDNY